MPVMWVYGACGEVVSEKGGNGIFVREDLDKTMTSHLQQNLIPAGL
jgi:hypothetical protein